MSGERYLIAGLGNIGLEYANTRHNIGFMTLDVWSQASDVSFETKRYGDIATINAKGRSFILLKPSTYMNLSGNAIRYWMNELNIPIERVLVICDDINLPFCTPRMRKSGSAGGHNGLKNIIELVGSENFTRIRMGVGHEFAKGRQIDFVLGKMSEDEIKIVEKQAEAVISAIQEWAFCGADRAMTTLNAKKV